VDEDVVADKEDDWSPGEVLLDVNISLAQARIHIART
jgi:hypothetical protein